MIAIDVNKCAACGFCESVCPTGAITVDKDGALIDGNRCSGCGRCIESCPRNAIRESVPQPAVATAPAGTLYKGKEVKGMYGRGMTGFGRGTGRGFGFGRGFGYGGGMGFNRGFGFDRGRGRGWFCGRRGVGNPCAYGRFAPWSPGRRWAGPNAAYYGSPYDDPYGYHG